MAVAGYGVTLYGKRDTGTATTEIDGIDSVSFTLNRESIDVSEIDTSDDWRKRILGLQDGSISLSGHFVTGVAEGQDGIREQHLDGGLYYVRLLPDGTNGFEFGCRVVNISFNAAPDGKAGFQAELELTTDVTEVS